MKNILAENLLRFGVKNLNEKDKAVLSEALLLEQIQQVDNALKELNAAISKAPTILAGTYNLYPSVSILYTKEVVPPYFTNTGTPKPIGKAMNYAIGARDELNYVQANSKALVGKTLPIGIQINPTNMLIPGKQENKNLRTWMQNLRPYSIKLWRAEAEGVTTVQAKSGILKHLNNYYSVQGGKFWGISTDGVAVTPQTTVDKFNTQVDSLITSLSSISIKIHPAQGVDYWLNCLPVGVQNSMGRNQD